MEKRNRMLVFSLLLSTTLFNGVMSQAVECANPADIMFLIDGSDSIDDREWDQARNFVARMIGALDISPDTINVGMTVYSSSIAGHYSVYPFKYKIVLTGLARSLQHPTGIATNTALGIMKVRETFREQPPSRRDAPKIMIVITDGSSENPAETINQAQMAKAEGIRIIAVGVGNNVFVEELQQIASNQRKYYQAADFTALQGIEADIRNMICRVIVVTPAPVVTFVPPTPPREIPVQGDRICNVPGDIVFVIDGSDSISDADYIRLKNFVANLIGNFEIGTDAIHVGMLVYSTLVGDTVGLFPPKQKLILQALARNLKHPRFGTDTALGIERARDMIRQQGRPYAPEIIVVITDGRSSNPRNTIIQANLAKASGITIIAIGVGTAIFSEELNQIASGPSYVSEVADFRALQNTVNLMRNLICTSITTTTTTALPPTMPPYIEPPAEGLICSVPGDVVFLLDGSDSIKPNDWIRQRNFVANLINNLEVGPLYIHVAVVVYSSTIGEEVELTPFKPKPVLNGLVKNLKQPRFGTDTALGIQRARGLLKTQGRANAPKVIIVVTDGKSVNPDNTLLQANMAKADGITVISVGVGSDVFPDELRNIATSERKTFQVIDFAALKNIIGTLRDLICRLVQTTTVPPLTTTTTPPTTTTEMMTPRPVPLYPCSESYTAADLVFLMDGTKFLTPYNWMMSTHFMSNFLDGIQLTNQHMHVGVVVSDSIRGDSIGITPFKTRFHLKELMHGLLQPSGSMDTGTGIRKVIDIFGRQGRRNAQKLMVVLTDGSSKSVRDTSEAASQLKAQGADIVAVGVGNNVNVRELKNIASNPYFVLKANSYDQILNLLPRLQNIVCTILRKPTTPATTPPPIPKLCEGCLIEAGVGFNPYPGDCTKFVQCWKEGNTVKYLIRSCPFGQFWDADAITCRPSFLVRCTADPCLQATPGFTYGMPEYGCRSYWKCIDGFSVGHCCPVGSAYVEGMGCLERPGCNEECPPSGGIAMQAICDKKAHWDKRYYIEIIYGRGEVVRPCPPGTIFFSEKCTCDYGLSALLPESHVMCKPAAFFSFDKGLEDQSPNKINVGVTNVQRTNLGTAYFDGSSDMNLWRFAGTDWGPTLVIKFKFRFDYSNKFIDYGGLPVDLGTNLDMTMNLISDFQMTDDDWRLWNQINNVRTLADWQQLLQEFGQSRTFYIFLGALGFKPGTFNSLQVVRILSTPEAFAEFRMLLGKLQQQIMANVDLRNKPNQGLRSILAKLRSYNGLVNWDNIIRNLKGQDYNNTTAGANAQTTVVNTGGQWQPSDMKNWRFDTQTQQWIRIGSTSGSGVPVSGGSGTSTVVFPGSIGGFNTGGTSMGGFGSFGTTGFGTGTMTGSGGGSGLTGLDMGPMSGAGRISGEFSIGTASGSRTMTGSSDGTGSAGLGSGLMSGTGGMISGGFSTGSLSGTGTMTGSGTSSLIGSGMGSMPGASGMIPGTSMGSVTGSGVSGQSGFGTGSVTGTSSMTGTGGLTSGGFGTGTIAGTGQMSSGFGSLTGSGSIPSSGGMVSGGFATGSATSSGSLSGPGGVFPSGSLSGGTTQFNMTFGGNFGGNILDMGGVNVASEWRWNSKTGQWERLAAIDGGGIGGSDVTITNKQFRPGSNVNAWSSEKTTGGKSGSMSWNFEAGTSKSGSVISAGAGAGGVNQMGSAGNTKGGVSWDQIRQQVQLQNANLSAPNLDSNMAAIMALFKKIQGMQGQGQGQGQTGQSGQVSWQYSSTGTGTGTGGLGSGSMKVSGTSGGGVKNVGGAKSVGGAISFNDFLRQMQLQNFTSMAGTDTNKAAFLQMLNQIQTMAGPLSGQQKGGSSQMSWQWSNKGGTVTGDQLDTKRLDAILRQIQEAAMAKSGSMTGGAGMGSNQVGSSKRTIQEVVETSMPANNEIIGGRVVGGAFRSVSQSSGAGNTGAAQMPVGATLEASFSANTQSVGGKTTGGGAGAQFGQGSASGQFGQRVASGKFGQQSSGGAFGQGSASGTIVQAVRSGTAGQTSSGGTFGQASGSDAFGQAIGSGAFGQASGSGAFGQASGSGAFGQASRGGTFGQSLTGRQGSSREINMITQTLQGEPGPGFQDRSVPRGAQAKGVKVERKDGEIIGLNIPKQGFISGATVIGKGEEAVRVTKTEPQIRITDIVQEVNPVSLEASSVTGGSGFMASGGGDGMFASGSGTSGRSSSSSQFVSRQTVTGGGSGMAGGEFTQLGKVVGSGGGVKRIVDTHVKRIPGGAVKLTSEGGVDLASLGLGGAEGANIIRQTVRVDPGSSGRFIDANTLNRGSVTGGSFSGMSSSTTGGNVLRNKVGVGRVGAQANQGFFPFITPDGLDTLLDGFAGKKRRKRSVRSSRNKRATNKQDYQALVTNCQGQDGQGPSIMVVANQGDVQFALKTYGAKEPGIVSVPAVEGWNDVTLIYDGKTLTGVVENWKGFFKSSVNLSGSIERRQAGLLVGSCQGYTSFHGEMDDLTVYKCLTPDIMKLRDRLTV